MLKIQQNIPLAPYTTLKIGGLADYFTIVESQKNLFDVIVWAKEKNLSYFILGNGSNILVSDQGFRGLIIKFQVSCPFRLAKQGGRASFNFQNNVLIAAAGLSMSKLAKMTAEQGLTGLEFGIGVPGTVGGAIWGNAGACRQEIKDTIQAVRVLMPQNDFKKYFAKQNNCFIVKLLNCYKDEGIVVEIDNPACRFGYRYSIFKKHSNWIILSAEFKLKKDNPTACQKRLQDILKNKIASQPIGEKSIGSIFKNYIPANQKENKNIFNKFRNWEIKKLEVRNNIPAWWLIDSVGLRGFQIGGAEVSQKHANFIVNTNQATAEDFVILISLIKQKVRNKFGIQLKEEIRLVGF